MSLSNQSAIEIANRWACSPRTVRRWVARGINVVDPLEVASAIAGAKSPTIQQLRAAKRELTKLQKKIS